MSLIPYGLLRSGLHSPHHYRFKIILHEYWVYASHAPKNAPHHEAETLKPSDFVLQNYTH